MDEQTIALFQDYLDQQLAQNTEILEHLQTIADDLTIIRQNQEAFGQALTDYQMEKQESEQSEQVPEYKEDFQFLQASASDMQAKLDNIDKTFTALDIDVYKDSFAGLSKQNTEMGTTAQQTNSFLVVIGFGVFILIGILLAKTVWRRL